MNYEAEYSDDLREDVDCYWEASLPHGVESLEYPSLPEPYFNLFVPLQPTLTPSVVKGISERADLFPMASSLFGVRMHLRGFYRTGWGPPARFSSLPVSTATLADFPESLENALRSASGFAQRVQLFRDWMRTRTPVVEDSRADRVSRAHEHLLTHHDDPSVIRSWSERSGFSVRTITRWFTDEIGMPPKRLARVARFHHALAGLHGARSSRFYLDAGYYDQAHFIREFKEFTGMTPEAYLRLVAGLGN